MALKMLTPDEVIALLVEHPARIAEVTDGLTSAQLTTAPEDGEWSAVELLAHLRSCGDVWGECMRRIVAEKHPTIRALNPRTWIERTDYRELDFRRSFGEYQAQRLELVGFLRALPADAWSRSATVTGAGRTLERTVRFYADWLANHERAHLRQFRRIAAANRL